MQVQANATVRYAKRRLFNFNAKIPQCQHIGMMPNLFCKPKKLIKWKRRRSTGDPIWHESGLRNNISEQSENTKSTLTTTTSKARGHITASNTIRPTLEDVRQTCSSNIILENTLHLPETTRPSESNNDNVVKGAKSDALLETLSNEVRNTKSRVNELEKLLLSAVTELESVRAERNAAYQMNNSLNDQKAAAMEYIRSIKMSQLEQSRNQQVEIEGEGGKDFAIKEISCLEESSCASGLTTKPRFKSIEDENVNKQSLNRSERNMRQASTRPKFKSIEDENIYNQRLSQSESVGRKRRGKHQRSGTDDDLVDLMRRLEHSNNSVDEDNDGTNVNNGIDTSDKSRQDSFNNIQDSCRKQRQPSSKSLSATRDQYVQYMEMNSSMVLKLKEMRRRASGF